MTARQEKLVARLAACVIAVCLLTKSDALAARPETQSQTPLSNVLLKQGAEVRLKLRDKLSSKTAVEGDPVNLILDQDLKVGDVTVASAGSPAMGTISHVKKAGRFGQPGDLGMTLEYLRVGDSQVVRLRGIRGRQGQGKEGTTVVLTVLFGPIGLVKHGRNATLEPGTPVLAYVDQDEKILPVK